jgi:hypothetical protein
MILRLLDFFPSGSAWDAKQKIGSFQLFYDARGRLLPWIKEHSPCDLVYPGAPNVIHPTDIDCIKAHLRPELKIIR